MMIEQIWTKLRKPYKVEFDKATSNDKYAKIIIEPLEKSYAITIGNSLRRVLLSSMMGWAITGIRINGISHEFEPIEGVYEDISQIILNLKKVRIKSTALEPISVQLVKEGPCKIKAGDLELDERMEILNPDLYIAEITGKIKFVMDLDIKWGRGYHTAEENKKESAPFGYIPIDSIFSPIEKVAFQVEENVRVGLKRDYERLILEIWTDGSITPKNALIYSSRIMKEYFLILENFEEQTKLFLPEKEDIKKIRAELKKSVTELELSKRPSESLKKHRITTLKQLVSLTQAELLKFENFGQQSLKEIKEKLAQRGLYLGMDVSKYKKETEEK